MFISISIFFCNFVCGKEIKDYFCTGKIIIIKKFFKDMISRRILRTKALHTLYGFQMWNKCDNKNDRRDPFKDALNQLDYSIDKSYELYNYMLLLVVDVAKYATERIEFGKNKKRPNQEELNPNTRFIDNKVIDQLLNNSQFQIYLKDNKISWVNDEFVIKKVYKSLIESDFYKKYMNCPNPTYKDDKQVIIDLFAKVVVNNEDFFEALEEKSIFWNDEIEFVMSMVIKTIKTFNQDDTEWKRLMNKFANSDDEEFVTNLFKKAVVNHDKNIELINKFTHNWDIDRIAFIDTLLMELAITELNEFKSIPVKVTLNEYIDLAKEYSTKSSKNFINGVLDKISAEVRIENALVK